MRESLPLHQIHIISFLDCLLFDAFRTSPLVQKKESSLLHAAAPCQLPRRLPAKRVLLVPMQCGARHTFDDCAPSLSSGSMLAGGSGHRCFLIYPVYVLKCLAWVSEYTQPGGGKGRRVQQTHLALVCGWHPLTPVPSLFLPSPQTNWATPPPLVFTPSF